MTTRHKSVCYYLSGEASYEQTYRYKPVPGERIGDLPHKPAHREQAPEAIRIPLAPDAGATTVATRASAQAAMRTFIVR